MAKKKKTDKYENVEYHCGQSTSRFLDCRIFDILEEKSIYDMIKYCYQVGFVDGMYRTAENEDLYESALQIVQERKNEEGKK